MAAAPPPRAMTQPWPNMEAGKRKARRPPSAASRIEILQEFAEVCMVGAAPSYMGVRTGAGFELAGRVPGEKPIGTTGHPAGANCPERLNCKVVAGFHAG